MLPQYRASVHRTLVFASAFLLIIAACDRGSTPEASVPTPETLVTLPSCDSLADVTVDLLQSYLDEVGGMSLEELLDPAVSGARLADLDAASVALTSRAVELGCTNDDLSELVADGVAELRAEGPLAERYLELVAERVGVTLED